VVVLLEALCMSYLDQRSAKLAQLSQTVGDELDDDLDRMESLRLELQA